jgi:endoglucanase
MLQSPGSLIAILAVFLLAGCQSGQESSGNQTANATTAPSVTVLVAPPAASSPAVTPVPMPALPVHIKAGPSAAFTDADGNVWIPEQGFVDGDTTERPDLQITNTKTPVIYQSERYNMSAFSYPVPNGKYVVKLHFCETYEGITKPGERVFSFNIEGQEFKDFDIWVKAGGFLRAYIETVNVEVTDGKLDITFTPKVEYPQINGIEIFPAP